MIDVYWLEQVEDDVPANEDWLGPNEALRLSHLRVPKRRADWLLGRWTAKRAVATYLNISDGSLASIEILAAASGAPDVFLNNQRVAYTISLTHCSGRAACAIVSSREVALGCDLERIETRSPSFISDFFAPQEQVLIQQSPENRSALPTLLWSAKESALKALHTGLRRDTRTVIVDLGSTFLGLDGWHSLRVLYDECKILQGWWRAADHFVRTLVSSPRPDQPIRLDSESFVSTVVDDNSQTSSLCADRCQQMTLPPQGD